MDLFSPFDAPGSPAPLPRAARGDADGPTVPRPAPPAAPLARPQTTLERAHSILPEALRELVRAMEPVLLTRPRPAPARAAYARIADAVNAWVAGDHAASAGLVLTARAAAAEPARGAKPRDPVRRTLHERLPGAPDVRDGEPLLVAADASWVTDSSGFGGPVGYGYSTTDGRWGVHSGAIMRPDGRANGVDVAAVHELRAIALAMQAIGPDEPLCILSDNRDARTLLRAWHAGAHTTPPMGERHLQERDGEFVSLTGLARLVAGRPGLQVPDVRGHDGHLLNELADSLAGMARRHSQGHEIDLATKGADITRQFLLSWASGAESRTGGAGRRGHVFPEPHPVKAAR